MVHAAQERWELGIDDSEWNNKDAGVLEKTFDNFQTLGATWFRIGPSSGSKRGVANFVDLVRRAKNHKLNVLVNIGQFDEDYDGGNANAPINKGGWKAKKLSEINLKKFSLRLQALCDALKAEGLAVDAFEIGNEDDQNPYDADVPEGHPASPAETKTWLKGYGEFLRTAAEIVHDKNNFPQAKIITFGIAHIPDMPHMVGHLSNPASYVAMLSNVDGVNYLDNDSYHVDGFGTHLYPSPSDVSGQTARLLRQDINALGRSKPLWITEFGFLTDPHKNFPSIKHQTLEEALTELLNTIEDFHRRLHFGPAFFYQYGGGWLVDDSGNLKPISQTLSQRAGHWQRIMIQEGWNKSGKPNTQQ
jgi:hypothetical protein